LRLSGFGLFQAGFDSLQGRDTIAFHVALARSRQNRFGKEAMLHAKTLLDGFFQEFAFRHGHIGKITNEFNNRKSILVETKTARVLARAVAPQFLRSVFYTS